ncbi:MAG TPA: LytTR family transcriptional regulator DNA-binding domain-containing protein [Bacteroidales bacterium]|jgi:two-component system LytT family response regulator|nr:LytTR family transcriptional regulator DNA-binding domain-containing protein [Bacteroidales bacterium]
MEPIKALIIDDEELARSLIRNYLNSYNDIRIIGECENGFEGARQIAELKPDLVFLDIQMPKLNGFEMLELTDNPPEIIFITAHNDFAIRAFELNAVDYLLKPYSRDRLVSAVQKATDRIRSGKPGENKIEQLLQQPLTEKLERIVVKSGSKIKVIPVDKINYLEAQDDYIMVYTDEGKHLKQGTMKYYEDHLDESKFIRVHRSYIVRIDQVVQLEPYAKDNYILKLKNGTALKISRNGLKNLKEKFNF